MQRSDAELVELIKRAFNFKTDIELADFLGVWKETISGIRNGRTPIGEGLRFTILDKIVLLDRVAYRLVENKILLPSGESNLSFSQEFSPSNLRARLISLRRNSHERWALSEIEDGKPNSEDRDLLDLYREFKGFKTDTEVARALGLRRNSISMVRHGHNKLGPLPRLRIYRDVTGGDTTRLESALESSQELLEMVKDLLAG